MTIIKQNGLWGLLSAQFWGAFNDNAWKLIVFTLATRAFTSEMDHFESASQFQATLGFVLFLLPMLIFSLPGGVLADRFSKRSVLISTKGLEVLLMMAASYALWVAPNELLMPYSILALMGVHSALFSPSKYGILPELLPKERLTKGNSLLEMWSMLAIIGGTGLGPIFLAADREGTQSSLTFIAPICLLVLSCIGFFSAFFIPACPPKQNPTPLSQSVKGAWRSIRADKVLYLAIIGSAFYWFIMSLLGQNVLVYAKSLVVDLQRGELMQGIPPAAYGLGIALGAWLAGKLSGERIETGLIPLGALGFAASSLLLGFLQPELLGTVLILILMGAASGLVVVPLHAMIQWRAPKERRGGILALGNVLDIATMMAGSLLASGMAWAGISLGEMLILSSLLVLWGTIWAVRLLPDALIRLIFILLTLTFYRIKVLGSENIPKKGPALLACNHLSIVDALFVLATAERPVRFLMKEEHFRIWWVKPIATIMGAIPISSLGGTKNILKGMREASGYLEEGQLVCVFPEGAISRTGMMLPFQRGIEVIMRDRRCPIIPIHLDRVWGSVFSFDGGRVLTKIPLQIPYPLTVSFGSPLPPETSAVNVRQAISELGSDAWNERKNFSEPVHRQMIRQVHWKPWKTALVDEISGSLSRLKALAGAIMIAHVLKKEWIGQPNIGLMLPPSVAGILANLAASLSCRTIVNINFTSGEMAIASAVEQAELKTLVTSRQFLSKYTVSLPPQLKLLYLEDVKKSLGLKDKILGVIVALFCPFKVIERYCGAEIKKTMDDAATIIFTSGSTGKPKGAVLSHFNIHANVSGVSQIIPPLAKQDKLLMALPLFHSFGFMQMWLGLIHNYDLILHPSPLDAAAIGQLVDKYKPSIMMTTPTFLKVYMQRVPPHQFGAFKCILTGAEKLSSKLADEFEDRFGIRPIEGYGTTECSPVIATCTPNARHPGVYQPGTQKGTVGHPLPGVTVKIVRPDTFEALPCGEEGLLMVKGPNVMQSYLHQQELTDRVMRDGWYITGDVATMDEEGILRITDRLSRFSKIGGEMVPHGTVEEALHQAVDTDDRVFAVTALPDEKKGERLAVLYTVDDSLLKEIISKLSSLGLPNLFLPKLENFIRVDELPLLGSGKLDLSAAKAMAEKALEQRE